jgi:CHASE2 domain-containing sensor protein
LFVLRGMAGRLWRMWFWTHSGRLPGLLATVNLVLLAAALAGIVLTRRRWRQLLVLYVVIGYYVALHSVLYAIFRYLMPVVPALITFAAAAGWGVVDRLRRRRAGAGA